MTCLRIMLPKAEGKMQRQTPGALRPSCACQLCTKRTAMITSAAKAPAWQVPRFGDAPITLVLCTLRECAQAHCSPITPTGQVAARPLERTVTYAATVE